MRSLLVIMAATASARAEPTLPMKPIADRAAALEPDPRATCASVGTRAVAGLGTTELHVGKGANTTRYAVVVDAGGKLWSSAPFVLEKSRCASGDCDVLDDVKPSLRVVTFAGKPLAAAVIDARFHHEHAKAVSERWTSTVLIACGAPTATPVCTTRTWGERGNSCTVDVKPDGDVDAKCAADAAAGSLIDEANKAYDGQDFDTALAKATAVLANDPSNVRMLRLVVSIKCITGEPAAAQAAANKLPARDLEQMKRRCARYGVTR